MKTISGKRLAQILRARGWVRIRVNGSHHTYQSPDGTTSVTVPVHANEDLKKGIQAKLMKQAGLTDSDL